MKNPIKNHLENGLYKKYLRYMELEDNKEVHKMFLCDVIDSNNFRYNNEITIEQFPEGFHLKNGNNLYYLCTTNGNISKGLYVDLIQFSKKLSLYIK